MRVRYQFSRIIIPLSLVFTLISGWCISSSYVEASEEKSVYAIKHFIRVPMTRQNNNYTCGVTALQSIFGYYGVDKRLDELSAEVKPDVEDGTNYLTIASYAKAQGFAVSIRTNMTLDELKGNIDKKRPVLLAIQAWADCSSSYSSKENMDGHYVVAIGYDDKNFYFMDPSTLGHYTYIPTEEFVSRWHDYDSYGSEVLIRFGMIMTKQTTTPYNYNEITRLD